MKVFINSNRIDKSLFTTEGIQVAPDPKDEFDVLVTDIYSIEHLNNEHQIYLLLDGTIADWAAKQHVKQLRPDTEFFDSIPEIIGAIKTNYAPRPNIEQYQKAERLIVCPYANKGGVGKSTTAISIAITLANYFPVALCDCDYGGPNIPSFFRIKKSAGNYFCKNALDFLHPIKTNLYLLPAPSEEIQLSAIRSELVYKAIEQLHQEFPVVVVDTPQQPWQRPFIHPVFTAASLVYAVVNQSVFSLEETRKYAPELLAMRVKPENIRLVINQYDPTLISRSEVEHAFASGFKKSMNYSPKTAAIIPEDHKYTTQAMYKSQITHEEVWDKLCAEIVQRVDRGKRHETKNQKTFFSNLFRSNPFRGSFFTKGG